MSLHAHGSHKEGLVGTILKRWKKIKSSRHNWDAHWRDVAQFVMPEKNDIWDWKSRAKGEEKHLTVYDSSPIHFNELLASAFHSMLTNPASLWFDLLTMDKVINALPEVRDYLQEVVKTAHLLLNNSNFQTEIHETFLDLGGFGTAPLMIEEDDEEVFRFSARTVNQLYLAENSRHQIDTFYMETVFTVRTALQKFGAEVFEHKDLKPLLKDMEQDFIVLHVVMPNEDVDSSKADHRGMPFASFHIYEKKKVMLKEGGFNEFPAAIPRWIKVSGEIYGRSPATKSLPDIRMLNQQQRTTIRAAQKVVDPPLAVPDDTMIQPNMTPGGLNPYRAGTQDRIFPIETRGDIGIGLAMMDQTRQRIKENFFIDQLQLKDGPQMTATEVNARVDEHLRLFGPILGRLHHELLKPLIARVLGIMKRKKLMPPNPPEVLNTVDLEVFFSSQIARAQRLTEAQNFNRFLAGISPTAQTNPEILDNIDPDKVLKFNADIYGIPQDIFRKPKEVDDIRKARAEAQAREQEQVNNQAGADLVNSAADTTAKAEA